MPETQVCAEGTQSWQPLHTVINNAVKPARMAIAPTSLPVLAPTSASKPCPMCGEQILTVAKKCKHCGEFFDGIKPKKRMDSPEIWNPTAAANWSVFFFPFGAFIHYRNAKALGRDDEARKNIVWFLALIVTITVWQYLNIVLIFDPVIGLSFGVLMLVLWYFTTAKQQIHFVADNYGSDYKKKGWFLPIFVSLFLLIIWMLGSGLILLTLGSMR